MEGTAFAGLGERFGSCLPCTPCASPVFCCCVPDCCLPASCFPGSCFPGSCLAGSGFVTADSFGAAGRGSGCSDDEGFIDCDGSAFAGEAAPCRGWSGCVSRGFSAVPPALFSPWLRAASGPCSRAFDGASAGAARSAGFPESGFESCCGRVCASGFWGSVGFESAGDESCPDPPGLVWSLAFSVEFDFVSFAPVRFVLGRCGEPSVGFASAGLRPSEGSLASGVVRRSGGWAGDADGAVGGTVGMESDLGVAAGSCGDSGFPEGADLLSDSGLPLGAGLPPSGAAFCADGAAFELVGFAESGVVPSASGLGPAGRAGDSSSRAACCARDRSESTAETGAVGDVPEGAESGVARGSDAAAVSAVLAFDDWDVVAGGDKASDRR